MRSTAQLNTPVGLLSHRDLANAQRLGPWGWRPRHRQQAVCKLQQRPLPASVPRCQALQLGTIASFAAVDSVAVSQEAADLWKTRQKNLGTARKTWELLDSLFQGCKYGHECALSHLFGYVAQSSCVQKVLHTDLPRSHC